LLLLLFTTYHHQPPLTTTQPPITNHTPDVSSQLNQMKQNMATQLKTQENTYQDEHRVTLDQHQTVVQALKKERDNILVELAEKKRKELLAQQAQQQARQKHRLTVQHSQRMGAAHVIYEALQRPLREGWNQWRHYTDWGALHDTANQHDLFKNHTMVAKTHYKASLLIKMFTKWHEVVGRMRDDWYAKMSASHALKVDHTSPTRDKVMFRVNSRASVKIVRTRSSSRTTASSSRTPRRSKTTLGTTTSVATTSRQSSSRQRNSRQRSSRQSSLNNEDVLLLTPTIKKADVTSDVTETF
jgi:hypothetical protein